MKDTLCNKGSSVGVQIKTRVSEYMKEDCDP